MNNAFFNVKLDHTRVSAAALVDKSRTNVTKMTGNAAYATPSPSLAEIASAADILDSSIQAYSFTRSRLDKQQRDHGYAVLKNLRRLLGSYVQNESKGDQALISSAGFQTDKERQPFGVLPAPQNVRAVVMPYPGQVEVRFGGVKGRSSYHVFLCEGDPTVNANWSLHDTTSKNRSLVSGLVSDKVYFFRVVAIGAAGASPVSACANAKAA